jgi:hypothetical protein
LILPVVAMVFLDYESIKELCQPGWGRLVVDEMGYGYVVGTFASLNLPFVVVLALFVGAYRRDTRERRYAAGLCGHCGYDLTGNISGVCSECGTVGLQRRGSHGHS